MLGDVTDMEATVGISIANRVLVTAAGLFRIETVVPPAEVAGRTALAVPGQLRPNG
jgi:hypothetical protein